MIKTFRHKGLETFFRTGSARGVQPKHKIKIGLILDHLNAANILQDMNFPGSGLHPLKGNYKGFHSVSVSGNWRIVFQFEQGNAYQVDYLDYH
jgi:proteic killer suppression protein